jgi:hypothetical protein
MKINFDDSSYIELILSGPGKVAIILGAKDGNNPLNTVVNSAEITIKQLAELVADLNIPLPQVVKNSN